METKSIEDVSVPTVVLKEGESRNVPEGTVVIRLSLGEERLVETLTKASDGKVDIRVAGGWVRDKILGLSTYDVDIAVDSMSGVEFATKVQAYLKQTNPSEVHKVGVIAANPSQSKHLETATMVVYGIECDFCNLRAQEVYTDDSRIPTTAFGTPLEDAERRDFCCNALFWNLQTRQIEDWTGRGLDDLLRRRILVTPLDPSTTFYDDPLRVLRAVRFAIRFGFDLDAKLEEASSSKKIQDALMLKVSRERVGKELEGMLSGKGAKPYAALLMIHRLGLSQCVFPLPTGVQIEGNTVADPWGHASTLLEMIPSILSGFEPQSDKTVLDTRLFAMAVFLLPFRSQTYKDRKSKDHTVIEYMIKEGIKFKNKDVAGMVLLMEYVDKFSDLLRRDEVTRLEAGLLIRATKDLWVTCLLMAIVGEHSSTTTQGTYNRIMDMNLDFCWKDRPLLDGRAVIKLLGLPKGPVVSTYLQEQVRWMLEHPSGTKEECQQHLRLFKEKVEVSKKRSGPKQSHDGQRKKPHRTQQANEQS